MKQQDLGEGEVHCHFPLSQTLSPSARVVRVPFGKLTFL